MTDYTVLPTGPSTDGEIALCSTCGRNGLVEVTNDTTFYLHKKWGGELENGIMRLDWEQCPEALKRPANV